MRKLKRLYLWRVTPGNRGQPAEEDEGHKEGVGHVRPTCLMRVQHLICRLISSDSPLITQPPTLTGEHYVRPGLSRGTPAGGE